MSGLSSQHSYPNPDSNKLRHLNNREKDCLLNPIDDTEDFYDPFSDLSLFLANKIKKEIDDNGSVHKWSGKIEAKLLAKILPEFKKKFPKYRLGTFALKKVWGKVAYYYDKIQGQKGALLSDGTLNLKFMIRENLKSLPSYVNLPPYSFAQQLAAKLSECIATIEGKRPHLDHLANVIWAIQKHLLTDLSSMHVRSPYEDYDTTDKLIVKTLLEITSSEKTLSHDLLKNQIFKTLQSYRDIKKLIDKNQLTSSLSMVLAKKTYATSMINCYFSIEDNQKLESFIQYQIELSKDNQSLSIDEHRVELIQQILALYAIAQELPRNINEKSLRQSIHQICTLGKEKNGFYSEKIDQALFVFVNAQMHLINEKKEFENFSLIEDKLIESYNIITHLPSLSPKQMEHFELIIWNIIEKQGRLLNQINTNVLQIIEKEIGNTLIDNPDYSFRLIISTSLQFFKKVLNINFSAETLNKKIEIWTMQNDMLIRWIHFDNKNPLLLILKQLWKEFRLHDQPIQHEEFIRHALEITLKKHLIFQHFKKDLNNRLWILYKYLWYTTFSNERDSTYERFLIWHHGVLTNRYPDYSLEKIEILLKKLSDQLVPLAPFISMT